MLVQVEAVTQAADHAVLVDVRTSVGAVTARWRGGLEATVGAHHVEWELDEEFEWGLNCWQVEVERPRLCQRGSGIYFRGRLSLDGAAFAHLELADSVIDLGHVDALPEGMAGSWVELNLKPANVEVYSYLL